LRTPDLSQQPILRITEIPKQVLVNQCELVPSLGTATAIGRQEWSENISVEQYQ